MDDHCAARSSLQSLPIITTIPQVLFIFQCPQTVSLDVLKALNKLVLIPVNNLLPVGCRWTLITIFVPRKLLSSKRDVRSVHQVCMYAERCRCSFSHREIAPSLKAAVGNALLAIEVRSFRRIYGYYFLMG
jgi:hypothetical protein